MNKLSTPASRTAPASLQAVLRANRQFALDLYRNLCLAEGNLFFSPHSISTALAMTWAGARADTQAQMAKVLQFPQEDAHLHEGFKALESSLREAGRQGGAQLKTANSLWPRRGSRFLKEFRALLRSAYGVRLSALDFGDEPAARRKINAWVEEKTEERIKDLIPAGVLNALTRLVLVNAIYFKGQWQNPFDPQASAEAPFNLDPEKQVPVKMMTRRGMHRLMDGEQVQVLELPYDGERLSMLVVLPRDPAGLAKLEQGLSLEMLETWLGSLLPLEAEVSLPRFSLGTSLRLDETLRTMGMQIAFSDQADFSGMEPRRELTLGAVLHGAFVAVDEAGTEAAAATAVVIRTKAVNLAPVIFRADHPFLFLIHEKETGSILFMGRLTDPGK